MDKVTFVKVCVFEPTAPFIIEVRGPWDNVMWESITKDWQENPEDLDAIVLPELPANVESIWCVVEKGGDGHWDGVPFYWQLVPIRPLQYEVFEEEANDGQAYQNHM